MMGKKQNVIAEKTIESSYHDNNQMTFRDSPVNQNIINEINGLSMLKSTSRGKDILAHSNENKDRVKKAKNKKTYVFKKVPDEFQNQF